MYLILQNFSMKRPKKIRCVIGSSKGSVSDLEGELQDSPQNSVSNFFETPCRHQTVSVHSSLAHLHVTCLVKENTLSTKFTKNIDSQMSYDSSHSHHCIQSDWSPWIDTINVRLTK